MQLPERSSPTTRAQRRPSTARSSPSASGAARYSGGRARHPSAAAAEHGQVVRRRRVCGWRRRVQLPERSGGRARPGPRHGAAGLSERRPSTSPRSAAGAGRGRSWPSTPRSSTRRSSPGTARSSTRRSCPSAARRPPERSSPSTSPERSWRGPWAPAGQARPGPRRARQGAARYSGGRARHPSAAAAEHGQVLDIFKQRQRGQVRTATAARCSCLVWMAAGVQSSTFPAMLVRA